jgi:nucleosome binding factor SPN SPT16 subunit
MGLLYSPKGGAMHAVLLDMLCDFMIKSWEKMKAETVIQSFKKCGISIAMDGTWDGLLWDTDDEAETDSPDTEWNPCDDAVNSESQDVLDELFASDDECDDFAGF